ncbi:uncharacterized protein LOC132701423 [Cylas formicarius]|uniref:uncharacterized protein LOC132701423 n=1 Tax=Cylas formicarius TaxID=197179 RepID=UPI0029589CEF|nr:uncharacterized protein LOC132701423 [Cylas formicarius]
METNKNPYGHRLHEAMLQRFPALQGKTIQNILDQRRQLFVKHRLKPEVIQTMRKQVALELEWTVVVAADATTEQRDDTSGNAAQLVNPSDQSAHETLQECLERYAGLDQLSRPRIPRLRTNRDTKNILKSMNNRRLEDKIATLRREIGIFTETLEPRKPSKRVKKHADNVQKKYGDSGNHTVDTVDLLKQKLRVYVNRLRRYKQSWHRRVDNNLFNRSPGAFYRNLAPSTTDDKGQYPEPESIREFWRGIWQVLFNHKVSAEWIKCEQKKTERIKLMLPQVIVVEDLNEVLAKAKNWKAPGPDGIQNFWYKKFTAVRSKLADILSLILDNPQSAPSFLTKGMTYLLPKTDYPIKDPSKYRPITCLPTIYKILNGIIANKLYQHMDDNNFLSEEQKGCRRHAQGCKEQLAIDNVVTRNAIAYCIY